MQKSGCKKLGDRWPQQKKVIRYERGFLKTKEKKVLVNLVVGLIARLEAHVAGSPEQNLNVRIPHVDPRWHNAKLDQRNEKLAARE